MNEEPKVSETPATEVEPAKKEYRTPQLRSFGSIADLTKGFGSSPRLDVGGTRRV